MQLKFLAGEYADYFDYLISLVGGDEWWNGFDDILIRLFERDYYWQNQIDAGFKLKAEELRSRAIRDGISPISIPNKGVSCLEVLVILAIRADLELTYDPENVGENRAPSIFSDLMGALGFTSEGIDIDIAIDDFLSGRTKISRIPKNATLWMQVNQFYLNKFRIEDEEDN